MTRVEVAHRHIRRARLLMPACLIGCVLAGDVTRAQGSGDTDSRLTQLLGQFQSSDWATRANAFYNLLDLSVSGEFRGRTWLIPTAFQDLFRDHPERQEPVSLGLIELLGRENALRHGPASPHSEEFSNYRGDLIGAVAALHDRRAIPSLLDNIVTGNLATRGLAALGRESLELVLEVAGTNTGLGGEAASRRMSATITLAQMLDPTIVQISDPATIAKIKVGLMRASRDQSHWVRLSAIDGLARLPGSDVTDALKMLAEHDPYSRPGEPGQAAVYPVRVAAEKALLSRSRSPKD